MPKPHQTALRLTRNLRQPRPESDIYHEYNVLRQKYILETAARHFQTRDDDPAPLYNKTLLDVGCGESTIGEFLALSGADITAIDPNPEALFKAKASAELFGAPITFINTKAENLVKNQSKYDIILALDILEDAPDPSKMVWVLNQLLAPGGIIIFSSINRTPWAWFLHIFLSGYIYARTPRGGRSYWRFHTPAQLKELCRKAKLKVEEVQGMRFSLSKLKWKFSSSPKSRYLAAVTRA